jgi:hypothetical protein
MNRNFTVWSSLACVLAGVLASVPASAQVDYLTNHLESQRWSRKMDHDNRMRRQKQAAAPNASTAPGAADVQAARHAAARRLEPEYQMRVARDGKASADRWLSARARALGERDGSMARRALPRH